jgi:hypothetical protein
MRRRAPSRQRGIALLALLAVLVIGGTWYLVSRMQELGANRTAAERVRNAQVLNKAKQALIGYAIAQANHAGENNPGALPCPEAPGSFNATNGTDGRTNTGGCAGPAVGRYPWRTIGTDKLVDAAGEPLWYVVSTGWAATCSTCTTTINSNSIGQLTIDGVAPASLAPADTVIALIIAPGLAFSVPAATGCTAWNQARPATSGVAPDVRNYLECDNANGDSSFVTTGPSGSFNDQVVKVTVGDLMPGLEAAIANRVEREIVPQLKTVYNSSTWASNVSASNPVYPYPAPFANPGVTASFQGSAASCSGSVCRGLLPVIFTNNPGATTICTPGGTSLCDPMFVTWASGTIEVKSVTVSGIPYVPGTIPGVAVWTATVTNCTVSASGSPQSPQLDCPANIPSLSGVVTTNVIYEVKGIASNVGMALRKFDPAASLPGVTVTTAPSVAMSSTGSATMTFRGSTSAPTGATTVATALCGLSSIVLGGIQCRQVTISVPIAPLFPDYGLLNSNDATVGWFMRNEWYRTMYYAVARGFSPEVIASAPKAPACPTTVAGGYTFNSTCLGITNVAPASAQRAFLILTGRSVNGASRPSATLADYLEFGNAVGSFERQNIGPMLYRDQSAPAVATAYTDTGAANAYAISLSAVSVGQPIYFKVKSGNTNTGASTLNTPATGIKNIVNVDGSVLAASQILSNAVVQVVYDGTQYLLYKRPFNDRIVVVDSN